MSPGWLQRRNSLDVTKRVFPAQKIAYDALSWYPLIPKKHVGPQFKLLDFKSSAPTWFMIFVSEMADDRSDRPCWPSQKKEVDRGSIFQDNPTSCTRMENPSTASPGSLPFGAWLRDTQSSRIQRRHRFVKQASLRRKKWWERTCGMRQFEGATVFFPRNSKAPRYPYAPWCWYIYLQNCVIFGANVGKYTSTMDPMGILEVSGSRIHHIPSPWGLWNSGCKVSHLIGIYWTYHIYLLENYWHFNI